MNNFTTVRTFTTSYGSVHLYLVIGICTFGISANILNVLVLTRPPMRITAINIILCGLSLAQLLLLINYIIYTIYQKLLDGPCAFEAKTFPWLLYLLFNVNLNIVFHTIALVHTCLLAIFRYLAIHFPAKRFVSIRRVKMAVFSTYLCVPLVCGSMYASSEITAKNLTAECPDWKENWPHTYRLKYRDLPGLLMYNFWFFGVFCKLLPCLCLAVLSLLLIGDLRKADERRKKLRHNSFFAKRSSYRQNFTTSLMLLVIVFLFILVELPNGILAVLAGTKGQDFRRQVYQPLGDFFDMLTLLYSSINFVIYCTMSGQFRQTFRHIFDPSRCLKLLGKDERNGVRKSNSALTTNAHIEYQSLPLIVRKDSSPPEQEEPETDAYVFTPNDFLL